MAPAGLAAVGAVALPARVLPASSNCSQASLARATGLLPWGCPLMLMLKPPEGWGSGKPGKPWVRMHCA